MSKRLTIFYGDFESPPVPEGAIVLCDGTPGTVKWSESSNGIVEVRAEPAQVARPNGLAQMFANARRPESNGQPALEHDIS